MTITVHSEHGHHEMPAARAAGDGLWLSPADLETATDWAIKPEGLCRGPVCVPVPRAAHGEFVRDDAVNVATFWRYMGRPVVSSDDGDVWVLGERADERAAQLESLEAPDFAVPDLNGRVHRLSEHRGRKVLLATWASW